MTSTDPSLPPAPEPTLSPEPPPSVAPDDERDRGASSSVAPPPAGGDDVSNSGRPTWWRADVLAAWAFGAFIAVAFFLLVFVIGKDRWFLRDEWYFLAGRSATDVPNLFQPHNEHWSTVPILAYRALYALFGVRTYLPYLLGVVVLHLTSCVLLRVILRRNQVGPWVATIAAATFVLFGTGEENILWAFQIGMAGSVTFGLAMLLLVDHDGGFDRRTVAGLVCGVLSLMCSGIGIAMAIGIGGGMLLKRGWKVAAWSTAPLAAVYGVWYLLVKPDTTPFGLPTIGTTLDWVRTGMAGVFDGIGQHPIVAVLLAAMGIGGVVLIALQGSRAEWRARAGLAVGMALAAPLLFAMTSFGRWVAGVSFAQSSRYVYDATIFVLPLLAVGADAFARRWRWALVPVLALLLIGVPGNIFAFNSLVFDAPGYYTFEQKAIIGSAYSQWADQVPAWVRPEPDIYNGPDLTIGWLRQARDSGKLPSPPAMSDADQRAEEVRLGLAVSPDRAPFLIHCQGGDRISLSPHQGDHIVVRAPINVQLVEDGKPVSTAVPFRPENGNNLLVTLDGLQLVVSPQAGSRGTLICT
jgi:hypothetical protein